jgi:6-phosphogluconolactonase
VARLTVCPDAESVSRAAAERLTSLVEQAIAARGEARISLTGGTTPRRLYELLGGAEHPWRARIDWARLHLYWGDERHVPPDHPDSNYGMAREALLRHVPVPAAQTHRMRGELPDAHDAASDYEPLLPSRFDVMLLGLGEDAHIASIFPGSDLLRRSGRRPTATEAGAEIGRETPERGLTPRRVAAVWAPRLDAWRITLTPAAILDSDAIVMVVAGAAKAPAVTAAIDEPLDVERYPAQLLRDADERVEWFIDSASSGRADER